MIKERLTRLRAFLRERRIDAILINKEVNLHYFSGFRGDDTVLLVTADKALLITDSRYTEQAGKEAPLFTVIEQKKGLWQQAAECVQEAGWKSLAFEGNALFFDDYVKFKGLLPDSAQETTPVNLVLCGSSRNRRRSPAYERRPRLPTRLLATY